MRARKKTRTSSKRVGPCAARVAGPSEPTTPALSLIAPISLPPCGPDETRITHRRLLNYLGYADGDWLLLRAIGSIGFEAEGPTDATALPVERRAWVRSVDSFENALEVAASRFHYEAMSVTLDRVTPMETASVASEPWESASRQARGRGPRVVGRRALCLRLVLAATNAALSAGACMWNLDERVQAAFGALACALGDDAALAIGASDDGIRIFLAVDDLAVDDLATRQEFAELAESIVQSLNRRLQLAGFGDETCQIEGAKFVPLYGTIEHHVSEDELSEDRRTEFRCREAVRRIGLSELKSLAATLSEDADSERSSPASAPTEPTAPAAEEVVAVDEEAVPVEPDVDETPVHVERAVGFDEIVAASGLPALERGASLALVGECLQRLTTLVADTPGPTLGLVRCAAVRLVRATGAVDAPARLVDQCLSARVPGPPKPSPVVARTDWSSPVDGAALVVELAAFCSRFAILPPHAAVAAVLWCMHSHAIDATDRSPRLGVLSPTTQCGKGTVLAILAALVARPEPTVNAKASTVLDLIYEERPTLLIGAARGRSGHKADLLELVEQGYLRTGTALRRVGNETVRMCVFGAVAIAAIGSLPATLVERSILIRMKRCTSGERIERFDPSSTEVADLRRKCARWAADHTDQLRRLQPSVPEGLDARQAEVWMPLLAIAEAMGGTCVAAARAAAVALSAGVGDDGTSLLVLLLGDIRDVYDRLGSARLSSEGLVDELSKLEGRPWADTTYGRTFTKASLAAMLKTFDVFPETMRIEGSPLRGYKLEWFADAFERYLPAREEGAPRGATGAKERRPKARK